MTKTIGLTGGIGSGKSTVAQMLRIMGVPVYDCDYQAKRLMVEDGELVAAITRLVGKHAYHADCSLNISVLSDYFAASPRHVRELNAIVHPAVRCDLQRWKERQTANVIAFETAILYEAHLTELANAVWYISAPQELRINRVVLRSGCTREAVLARMAQQLDESEVKSKLPESLIITNDDTTALLPQVIEQLILISKQ